MNIRYLGAQCYLQHCFFMKMLRKTLKTALKILPIIFF